MFKFRLLFWMAILLCLLAACSPSVSNEDVADGETTQPVATAIVNTETPAEAATAVPAVPTAVATEIVAEATTEADNLDVFVKQLQTAVSTQDYATLQALMSDTIAVGAWRSEWRMYDPAQLIAEYQSNGVPSPTAVQFTGSSADEIGNLIGQPPATLLGPTINVVATLHSKGWGTDGTDEAILFVTEEDGQYQFSAFLYAIGSFADANMGTVAAPIGLIYRVVSDGVYQIEATGEGQQLIDEQTALNTNLQISPDGKHAAYYTDEASKLWLLNIESGETQQLAADYMVNTFMIWGDNETLFVGIFLDPNEAEGPNNGHISTVNIETGAVQILDETRLSGGRPALSADGKTVAFDVFVPLPAATAQLYHATNGLQPFDPTLYDAEGDFIRSTLFNPAWAADGNQIAWLTTNGERAALQVYNMTAKTAVQLFDWDPARFGGMVPSPVWSPNGQWIALEVLANGEEGGGLWLIASDESETRLISTLGGNPHWVNDELFALNMDDGPRLYDVNSDALLKMNLPTGSTFINIASAMDVISAADLFPVVEVEVVFVMAKQDVIMRSGPAEFYQEIGGIFDGQTARVTGQSEDGLWWRVICPDDAIGDCWVTADPAFTMPTDGGTN